MNTKQKYLTTGLALVLAGNIYAQECISNMCRQSESTLTISQIQAIQTEYKKVIGNPNVYQIDSYAREKFGWAGGPMRGNEVLLSVDLGGQKDLFLTNCDGINPGRLERITETPNKNEESPCFLPNGTITYHVRTQTFDTEFYLLINHNPLNKNPPLYTTKSTWERDHPTILQPPIAKLPPPPFFYNPAPITWPGELAVKGIQKIWKGIGSLF